MPGGPGFPEGGFEGASGRDGDVLKDLDAAGAFGDADARKGVVLGACYIGGDNSTEEFLAWAKQVNPPDVMRRLRKELKERGY